MFGHACILNSNIILINNLTMFFCYFVLIYCQYFELTKKKFILLLLQVLEILYVEQKIF